METLKLTISSIRNIKSGTVEIPLESGVYSLVGSNGCGKSTILLCLAQLISKHHLSILKKEDVDKESSIQFEIDGKKDSWTQRNDGWWMSSIYPKSIMFNGLYEGSLFYGTRFNDSRVIDNLLAKGEIKQEDIVDSDDYVKEQLSLILHNNKLHYKDLKRIRNKYITEKLGVSNTPYFNYNANRDNLISQYRMSSGECLLISLLHFLYNSVVRRSLPKDRKVLVLIDEIELALHPFAVSNLIDLLNTLVKSNPNLVVILTSHSPEVIRKVKPANLYKVNNDDGVISVESNCYPSYLIRDVYRPDGYDYLFLVEDDLIRTIVEKILNQESLRTGKLIHVAPVGGWSNVLKLQQDLLQKNVLGLNKQIVSILDGDIKNEVGDVYKNFKKLFLPIKSIEKYLYDVIIREPDLKIKRILSDKYFTLTSLDTLVNEHHSKYPTVPNQPDKKFYFRLKKDYESRNITEEQFITNLCDDIIENVDFSTFKDSLKAILN